MSFIKNFLSEDLGCDNSVIANPDTSQTVWPGGDPLTMFLLANDSDPEGNNFILTEIEGIPVTNGSGPLVFGDVTINVIDVTTGEITYELALSATETPSLTYTIQDDGIPPATDSAIFKPIFGLCNAVAFRGAPGGPPTVIVSVSNTAYLEGVVDVNDDGIDDATSGVIPNTGGIFVPGVAPVNGTAFEVKCYTDSAGLNLCDSDKRKFPVPQINETEPANPATDPYVIHFLNAGPDPYSIFYRSGEDIFTIDLFITGGTYAGTYNNITCEEGFITNISLLPVALQALITPTVQGMEFSPDLWNIEGATDIQVYLNAQHRYTVGAPLNAITSVSANYTP